jgi:hypothetical protein
VTDVGALSRRTIESLDALADRSIMVFAEPVVISVDPAKVERIVENLLMNAARHTKPDRTIWLRVQPVSDGVLIVVEDDGLGVPEELREAIFEPFRQGPDPRRRTPPGTGDRPLARGSIRDAARRPGVGRGARGRRRLLPRLPPDGAPGASDGSADHSAGSSSVGQRGGRLDSNDRCRAKTTTLASAASTSPIVSTSGDPERTHPHRTDGKPPWLKVRLASGPNHAELTSIMRGLDLHTVCEGGDVPEHRRMLGGARGHVPDPGRPMHPPLRLLRRDDGSPRSRR